MDKARKKRVSMRVPVQKVVDLSSTWDENGGGVFTQAPVRSSSQASKVKESKGENCSRYFSLYLVFLVSRV
jgi:hypothetical protein